MYMKTVNKKIHELVLIMTFANSLTTALLTQSECNVIGLVVDAGGGDVSEDCCLPLEVSSKVLVLVVTTDDAAVSAVLRVHRGRQWRSSSTLLVSVT